MNVMWCLIIFKYETVLYSDWQKFNIDYINLAITYVKCIFINPMHLHLNINGFSYLILLLAHKESYIKKKPWKEGQWTRRHRLACILTLLFSFQIRNILFKMSN